MNKTGRPVKWTEEKLIDFGIRLNEWLEAKPENIFFSEFCSKENVHHDLISDYRHVQDFSDLIKRAKYIQEYKLLEGALRGNLNPRIAIFLLKVYHGYRT